MGDTGGVYPTTIWAEILTLGDPENPAAVELLNKLLQKYYSPLQQHLVYKFQVSEEQAADWLQSFVLKKVLLKNIIAQAQTERGRFRNFLLRCLDNFVVSELRNSKKEIETQPLDIENMEVAAPGEGSSRDPFDLEWARAVLTQVLHQMEVHCRQSERSQVVWEVFQLRLLQPLLEGEEPIAYKELVDLLGFHTDVEAGNALLTAKRLFQRKLRSVVAEYAKEPKQIEAEIDDLKAVFANI